MKSKTNQKHKCTTTWQVGYAFRIYAYSSIWKVFLTYPINQRMLISLKNIKKVTKSKHERTKQPSDSNYIENIWLIIQLWGTFKHDLLKK